MEMNPIHKKGPQSFFIYINGYRQFTLEWLYVILYGYIKPIHEGISWFVFVFFFEEHCIILKHILYYTLENTKKKLISYVTWLLSSDITSQEWFPK